MRLFGEKWNFAGIEKTMEALGIKHDVYFNETTLYEEGKIEEVINRLGELGKTFEKEGALYLNLEEIGRDNRVIVKSSGEPTYRLPDIAYHVEKLGRGYDQVIDVLGADHIDAVPDVIAAVGMLGGDASRIKPVIHQMVSFVENGEEVKFSKRLGQSITLDELLEDLGKDVVRFFFVMRGANTHLEFDLGLAREQSDKNPVLYLQYAHARIAGLLRFAESKGINLNLEAPIDVLTTEEEVALIKQILEFPEAISRAARDLEPQIVAEYLRELATAFHKFYHERRIIGADTEAEGAARFRLAAMARTTLANGLNILGITALERM
ncbi:MAG: arginine--tRNA ligase, partial [Candidatus Kapaibacterium sp.]